MWIVSFTKWSVVHLPFLKPVWLIYRVISFIIIIIIIVVIIIIIIIILIIIIIIIITVINIIIIIIIITYYYYKNKTNIIALIGALTSIFSNQIKAPQGWTLWSLLPMGTT